MKILIAGLSKTGTTGLLYLVKNSLEYEPQILFEPKECTADLDNSGGVIAKILIGTEDLNTDIFARFDKKINILRDPRDRMVSGLLYSQFHANYLNNDDHVRTVKDCLKRKESNPASVSIRELLDVIGRVAGLRNANANFKLRTKKALSWFDDYVAAMPDGLLYKYEDFVSEDFSVLEEYLGFPVTGKAEVPVKLQRVVRTKGCGDWRNWFTEEDVADYRKMLTPWLKKYGYDAEDWQLNAKPVIHSSHCSEYFMRLVKEHRGKAKISSGGSAKKTLPIAIRGFIDQAKPRIVAGWAIGSETGKPVRVALLVDGVQIAQVEANRFRPGLLKSGRHSTGECGFVFRFSPEKALPTGAEVVVQPVSGKGVFVNSPSLVCEPDEKS